MEPRIDDDREAPAAPLSPRAQQQARRAALIARRDAVRAELEERQIEREIEQLEILRDASAPPTEPPTEPAEDDAPLSPPLPPTPIADDDIAVQSAAVAHATRPRLKEPTPFKGDSIKKARVFLRELALIFALSGATYATDEAKVLYGVMYLSGEASERWHANHTVLDLQGYTYKDFEEFCRDACGDPVNRVLNVMLEYETVKQKDNQTVRQFATELDVMEDQLGDYTEPQRIRHLLVKLAPSLRSAIVKFHDIPTTREELVILASRIESTERGSGSSGGNDRWNDRGQHSRRKRGAEGEPERNDRVPKQQRLSQAPRGPAASQQRDAGGSSNVPVDKSLVECYGCHRKGHFKTQCPNRHLWRDRDAQAVRRVETAKALTGKGDDQGKGRGPETGRS